MPIDIDVIGNDVTKLTDEQVSGLEGLVVGRVYKALAVPDDVFDNLNPPDKYKVIVYNPSDEIYYLAIIEEDKFAV